MLEIEKKNALQNFRLMAEKHDRINEGIKEYKSKMAEIEFKCTKLEIENKELLNFGNEAMFFKK